MRRKLRARESCCWCGKLDKMSEKLHCQYWGWVDNVKDPQMFCTSDANSAVSVPEASAVESQLPIEGKPWKFWMLMPVLAGHIR